MYILTMVKYSYREFSIVKSDLNFCGKEMEIMHGATVDYSLCNVLYGLASVLEAFPCEEMQEEIEQTLALIQNKCLKVAIIGEFRRGKSSLINALLGMPVLPVDIEPTTAAINRVTYGIKPKAIVHFKDGSSVEIPIQELSGYVTKLTPSSAQLAATIREAEILYPTELCSNHIDIIDTPGLNDTESMTSVTESLINDIHVAIVAIKATMPYSETECRWVTRLLALPKLTHIVFVLTCMDLVNKADVQKVLEYTRQRIREKTMECVHSKYRDDPELILKAERLFDEEKFVIYPVSAALALEAFDNGDYELLEQSNIPVLKKELLTSMNAQQQLAGVFATERVISQFSDWFSSVSIEEQIECLQRQTGEDSDALIQAYFAERAALIDSTMETIEWQIKQQQAMWLSEENMEDSIRKVFIKHLSAVTVGINEAIITAIRNAEKEVWGSVLPPLAEGLRKGVNATIIRNTNAFFDLREEKLRYIDNKELLEESGIPASAFFKKLILQHLQAGVGLVCPQFNLTIPPILLNQNIIQTLIIPYISLFARRYRRAWQDALPEYVQKWYSIVLQAEPIELRNTFQNVVYRHKGAAAEKIAALEMQYLKANALLEQGKNKIEGIKKEVLA